MSAPAQYPDWDTNGTNTTAIVAGHATGGFANNEVPTAAEMNQVLMLLGLWIRWFDSLLGAGIYNQAHTWTAKQTFSLDQGHTDVRTQNISNLGVVQTNAAPTTTYPGEVAANGAGAYEWVSQQLPLRNGDRLLSIDVVCTGTGPANPVTVSVRQWGTAYQSFTITPPAAGGTFTLTTPLVISPTALGGNVDIRITGTASSISSDVFIVRMSWDHP